MNFNDIFKSSFLENVASISLIDMAVTLLLAFGLGVFIFLVYKKTFSGVMYSSSFGGTLVALTMITSMTILAVTSNVVLSLGMVGALSIVRFRTAIKEPADTAFMFWAIATGIICGAGYVALAVLMTLLVGLLFVAVHVLGKNHKRDSYMVVLRCEPECDAAKLLRGFPHYRLKNKNITAGATELVAEVELSQKDMDRLESLRDKEGVLEITVMHSVSGSVL